MVCHVELTEGGLDVSGLESMVRSEKLGGVVTFIGAVRAETADRLTEKLFYEAHVSMAQAQMRKIAEEESARFAANVAVVHRLGELTPGETAVVCVAACAHRNEAFECCRRLIDRIKEDVPIWKKEFGPDGNEWV